jgi:hypothetical protein
MVFVLSIRKWNRSKGKKSQNRFDKVRVSEDTAFGGKQKEAGGCRCSANKMLAKGDKCSG